MSLAVEVKFEGLAAIEQNLRFMREQFGVKTGGVIIRGLRAGAKIIQQEAKSRVPHIPTGLIPSSLLEDGKVKVGVRTRKKAIFVGPKGAGVRINIATKPKRPPKKGYRLRALEDLLRSNIVEHAVGGGSHPWGFNPRWTNSPTVVVRVRNRGYERRGGRIVFNRPGSSPGWWWWIEFGTARMPARSFMRSAFEAKKHEAMQVAIATMRKEIDDFLHQNLKKAA